MMTRLLVAALLLAGALVLSCQTSSSGPPPKDQESPKPSPQSTPTPSSNAGKPVTPTANMTENETQAADLARSQLTSDRGIAADQMQVVKVEQVDWSDSSLGCPEPGMMYAQVITPGYRVILTAQGTTYEYHTAGTQRAVLCKK